MKKKPLEEKKTAKEKGKSAEGKKYPYSEKFVPRLGGQLIPDDYALSGAAEQNVWWALNVAEKMNRLKARDEEATSRVETAENNYKKVAAKNAELENRLKEAAMMLICEPGELKEAIQDRIKTCNRVEDLELQLSKEEKSRITARAMMWAVLCRNTSSASLSSASSCPTVGWRSSPALGL